MQLHRERLCRGTQRHGATLVELLVALLLFDMALLALVAVSAESARRLGEAGRRNRAVFAGTSRLEALTSMPCAADVVGEASLERGVTEHWASHSLATGQELTDSIRIESRVPESIVFRTRRLC